MATFDTIRREHDHSPSSGLRWFVRWLRRQLPTGLYARSLLIIIIPMVLLQAVVGDRLHGAPLANGHAAPLDGRDARYRRHHLGHRNLSPGCRLHATSPGSRTKNST